MKSTFEAVRPVRIPLHVAGALERLPEAPQATLLRRLARQLLAHADVAQLWLRGSLARGDWDRFSDVDLDVHLASSPWTAMALRPQLLLPRPFQLDVLVLLQQPRSLTLPPTPRRSHLLHQRFLLHRRTRRPWI